MTTSRSRSAKVTITFRQDHHDVLGRSRSRSGKITTTFWEGPDHVQARSPRRSGKVPIMLWQRHDHKMPRSQLCGKVTITFRQDHHDLVTFWEVPDDVVNVMSRQRRDHVTLQRCLKVIDTVEYCSIWQSFMELFF
ncbi:Uncharacterised protein r2_g2323 [Pycnogonum litorale]